MATRTGREFENMGSCLVAAGSEEKCLTLTPNNTETIERMTCHCFLRLIRRDLTSSSYTTEIMRISIWCTTLSIRGQFREVISLSQIISRYLRLQVFFQLYSYTLGYIKKIQEQHHLFLVKVVIRWLQWVVTN